MLSNSQDMRKVHPLLLLLVLFVRMCVKTHCSDNQPFAVSQRGPMPTLTQ